MMENISQWAIFRSHVKIPKVITHQTVMADDGTTWDRDRTWEEDLGIWRQVGHPVPCPKAGHPNNH